MSYKSFLRWCKRAKILLEVTVPLALALDGDATVFAYITAVELDPEFSHSDAGHRCMWCRLCACHRWLTSRCRCKRVCY
jgi:hypothetical protein